MNKIPFFTLSRQLEEIKSRIKAEISKIIDFGEYSCGKQVSTFESRYAEYEGAKYCVLLQSGTDALLVALQYYKDKVHKTNAVILPTQSFIATAAIPEYLGLYLDFVDVGDDCNLSLDLVLQKRLFKHSLFLPVGLYGSPPDLKGLRSNCPDSFIICDGAQMHGSLLDGKHPINYCDILTTSFYATKNLSCIVESGALLTNNPEIYEYALSFRNHGRVKNDNNIHQMVGLNFRPSEIAGASLNVKLDYLDAWTDKRIELAGIYRRALTGQQGIKLPTLNQNNKNVSHLFPVFVKNRDKVKEKMAKIGIGTGNQYPIPLHKHAAFKGKYDKLSFPNAEKQASQVITLPLYPEISYLEQQQVIENLIEVIGVVERMA